MKFFLDAKANTTTTERGNTSSSNRPPRRARVGERSRRHDTPWPLSLSATSLSIARHVTVARSAAPAPASPAPASPAHAIVYLGYCVVHKRTSTVDRNDSGLRRVR
ncbi:hypothetical protein PYW08_010968 [Mythimna loreyi]|uniref:Uncharacterized protein n=1 Tax=Mythimna loreyi TaxID=667449 RepID=A0ACC2Q233_9NEOP|nr:hypothetical protein PYW08_010968 [Mythimna loreyi]